jgi:beta,beta-carotene 9',10'-dioxygenase
MTASTPSETAAVSKSGRLRGLYSGAREFDEKAVTVSGQLPEWLQGSLLLNGPALWDLPQGGYQHWFDGHAMLHRIAVEPGGLCTYRSRFLQTEDYRGSVAAGQPVFGAFGSRDPSSIWKRLRTFGNPPTTDNGAVVMSRIGEQWIAQTETPLVTGFDADTLVTTGRIEFSDEEAMQLVAAHGITLDDGTYWNVGVELGRKCTYKVFSVAPGSRERRVLARIPVGKPGYLHAFAMTPGHVIVWEPAMRAQPLKFIFTRNSYMGNFTWEPAGGSRIHAVSRADASVRTWTIPPVMAFHAVQAYEDGADLVLDLCTSAPEIFDALTLDKLRAGRPVHVPHELLRYRLRPGQSDVPVERLGSGLDLPMVHGGYWTKQRAQLAWGAGFDPAGHEPMFDRTVKLDLDNKCVAGTWQRGNAVQLEPLFVERPQSTAEEDGVLMVPTLADNDEGTVVCVVDPATMRCLAQLHLPQVVPFGFHAAWKQD